MSSFQSSPGILPERISGFSPLRHRSGNLWVWLLCFQWKISRPPRWTQPLSARCPVSSRLASLSHWNDETVQRWVEGFQNAKPKRQKPGQTAADRRGWNSDKATAKGNSETWIDVVTGLMAPTVPKQKKKPQGREAVKPGGGGPFCVFFFVVQVCLFVVGVGFGVPEPKMMGNTIFAQWMWLMFFYVKKAWRRMCHPTKKTSLKSIASSGYFFWVPIGVPLWYLHTFGVPFLGVIYTPRKLTWHLKTDDWNTNDSLGAFYIKRPCFP